MGVPWQELIKLFSPLALAALLLKLFFSGLYRSYRVFTFLIAAALSQELALLPVSPETDLYAWLYFFSSPILWILEYLVLVELYSLALERYTAMKRFSRWALLIGLLLAIAGCALSVLVSSGRGDAYPLLHLFQVTHRTVTVGALILVAFVSVFSRWFPIVLNRNSVRYLLGYAVYFSAKSAALLLLTLIGVGIVDQVTIPIVLIPSLVVVFWTVKLNRSGESAPACIARRWDPGEKERLLEKLESVDSFLGGRGASIA